LAEEVAAAAVGSFPALPALGSSLTATAQEEAAAVGTTEIPAIALVASAAQEPLDLSFLNGDTRMKYALIDIASGLVAQWQDHDQFGYAEPLASQVLHEVTDGAPFGESPIWFVDGEFVAIAPQVAPAAPPAFTAAQVRAARDALLASCDWTQLPDVPAATRASWTAYREALRDVPEQAGFPAEVDWPKAPA
jgi:hypothetical protein